MLPLGRGRFAQGRSTFRDQVPASQDATAKVFVKIRLGDAGLTHFAQLDTGSAWSVMNSAIAEAIGFDPEIDDLSLDTRLGRISGQLVRLPITLLADEGASLDVEATFFISPEWGVGTIFLGYSGFLDRIRIALDPEANHFYFGAA